MKEWCEYVLSLCKDVEYAEARAESSQESGFATKNGLPEVSSYEQIDGIGVRIKHKGHMGFFSTNKLEKPVIKNMVQSTIAMLSKKAKAHVTEFSQEKPHTAHYEIKPKKDGSNLSFEDFNNILKDIDKSVMATKVKIPSRQLSIGYRMTNKFYMNSEGANISSSLPQTTFFWFLTVKQGSHTIQKYMAYDEKRGLEALNLWNLHEEIPAFAKKMNNILLEGRRTPSGTFSVILGPEVSGITSHESVGHPYEADRILGREAAQAGTSFIHPDMLGKQIGSEIVTVCDDPTIPHSAGFYLYDDEGVQAHKRTLIKKGMINEFLHNRETAAQFNCQSNASSRASSFQFEPLVRMANTYIEPGDFTPEEIVRETKEGIYLKNFTEWNIDDMRLNQKYVGLEAYYVKNGEIQFPIRNPVLEITTPTFWKSIDAIGHDLEHFTGSCGKGEPMQGIPVHISGPPIRLSNIKIK